MAFSVIYITAHGIFFIILNSTFIQNVLPIVELQQSTLEKPESYQYINKTFAICSAFHVCCNLQ